MELTRSDAVFSRITMVLFYVQKTNILGMTWNSTEHLRKNKKILAKDEDQGAHTLSTRVGGTPPLGRAPYLVGPLETSRLQLQLYISAFGEKK